MRFVVRRKSAERIFLHLNADKSNAGLCVRGELALCGGGDSQPVTGGEGDGLAVNDGLSASGNHTVDFLVVFMGMDEGDARARGELIDADLRAGQGEGVVQLGSGRGSNVCLCVVFHGVCLQGNIAISYCVLVFYRRVL